MTSRNAKAEFRAMAAIANPSERFAAAERWLETWTETAHTVRYVDAQMAALLPSEEYLNFVATGREASIRQLGKDIALKCATESEPKFLPDRDATQTVYSLTVILPRPKDEMDLK